MFKSFISLIAAAVFSGSAMAETYAYEVTFNDEAPQVIEVDGNATEAGSAKSRKMVEGKPVGEFGIIPLGGDFCGFGTLRADWNESKQFANAHYFGIHEKMKAGETVSLLTDQNEHVAQIKRIR